MARKTRAESQAETRTQLVTTAKNMFFSAGYHATTLEKVADAAGYSKGAVYSNFRNKDELCVAVLEEVRAEKLGEIMRLVADTAPADRPAQLQQWAQRVVGDAEWTSLEVEFAMHARRDEALRAELGGQIATLLALLDSSVQGADALETTIPTREFAIVMLALGIGLGLFRTIDPSIPVDGLTDTFKAFTTGR